MRNKGLLFKKLRDNIVFFVLSKGVAFLAPIFFLKFVALREYGVVEFSYAFGSVAAVAAMLGLNGAYPYFILRRGESEKKQAFLLYGLPVMGCALVACLLRWCGVIDQRVSLITLFTLIFALQRLYSSILKSEDKGYLGVLFDGGYYFLLTGVILLTWAFGVARPVLLLEGAMQCYLFALSAFFVWQFLRVRTKSIQAILHDDCREILRFSLHMVVSGFIVYWLTSSARIYIGYFLGYEDVGIYSFYFRLAGIAVVIHQFLYIAFFQKLYMADNRRLDLYYTIVMGLVLCGNLMCYFASPLLLPLFDVQQIGGQNKLFILLVIQMVIWCGISLGEGLIGRENLVRRMNFFLGILVLCFPVILMLIGERLTLDMFAYLNLCTMSMAFYTQMYILAHQGIVLRKCIVLNTILLFASTAIYFIL